MTESGKPDGAENHFDFDETFMVRHPTDVEAGPLSGTPPKVAFVICPMIVQDGYATFDSAPINYFPKPIFVLHSEVLLENWAERFEANAAADGEKDGRIGQGADGLEDQGSEAHIEV